MTEHLTHLISEHRSNIMGLSMLSVMLFHQYFTDALPFNFFHNFGYWGVEMFLFLSGMGLVNSLQKNTTKVFYQHRFNRIAPACVLCGSAKYFFFQTTWPLLLPLKDGLKLGIWSVASLDLWFIDSIIIFYILSPLLYRMLTMYPYAAMAVIFSVFTLNGIALRPLIGFDWLSPLGILSWTIERLVVFSLGMLAGIRKEISKTSLRFSLLFLLLYIAIIIFEKAHNLPLVSSPLPTLFLALGTPALITLHLFFLRTLPRRFLGVIASVGKISLELYLVHEFIFWTLILLLTDINPLLSLVVAFLLSFASAYICKYIEQRLRLHLA